MKSFFHCEISNSMNGAHDHKVLTHFSPDETKLRRDGPSQHFSGFKSDSELKVLKITFHTLCRGSG